jgi:chromatin structure-remodeling complex subunit RSC4
LAGKEFSRISGHLESEHIDVEDETNDQQTSEVANGEDKKNKGPNLTRLLKTRLQKLVEKTDDE